MFDPVRLTKALRVRVLTEVLEEPVSMWRALVKVSYKKAISTLESIYDLATSKW